jgi:hypothetical protein
MRLMTCLGLILLGGCAQLPDAVRVDVDGSSVEFKKKPTVPPPPPPATNAPATNAPATDAPATDAPAR